MGADLEFADDLTLGSALSGRRILSGGPAQAPRSGGILRPAQVDSPEPTPEASDETPESRPESPSAASEDPVIGHEPDHRPVQRSEVEQPRSVSVPHRP